MLASECAAIDCPEDLPDWGSGSGSVSPDKPTPDHSGKDEATDQYLLKTTHHGKYPLGSF